MKEVKFDILGCGELSSGCPAWYLIVTIGRDVLMSQSHKTHKKAYAQQRRVEAKLKGGGEKKNDKHRRCKTADYGN